jgi:hypothetical protein
MKQRQSPAFLGLAGWDEQEAPQILALYALMPTEWVGAHLSRPGLDGICRGRVGDSYGRICLAASSTWSKVGSAGMWISMPAIVK